MLRRQQYALLISGAFLVACPQLFRSESASQRGASCLGNSSDTYAHIRWIKKTIHLTSTCVQLLGQLCFGNVLSVHSSFQLPGNDTFERYGFGFLKQVFFREKTVKC